MLPSPRPPPATPPFLAMPHSFAGSQFPDKGLGLGHISEGPES